MAEIRRFFWFPWVRHLRSEPSFHLLAYRKGKLVRSGRGLAVWFRTLGTSIAEVPVDDRDLNFLIHGHSRDYQPVTVQGAITYRVVDAELLGQRVDFSLDLKQGSYLRQPLDQLATLFTGLLQQLAGKHMTAS